VMNEKEWLKPCTLCGCLAVLGGLGAELFLTGKPGQTVSASV
jgi:hypothetical protein